MFEPVEGKTNCVRDSETGIEMSYTQGQDYVLLVEVRMPDGRKFSFGVGREPKYRERPFKVSDPSNPTIRILMGELRRAAEFRNGTIEENTEFVWLILRGLSRINELWPLTRNPYFYGDRWRFVGRENIFSFVLPSDEEIAQL